tara:strand:- start:11524 stop:11727 length:204 start_codon:yes stop_codon:yes gene_type:complete
MTHATFYGENYTVTAVGSVTDGDFDGIVNIMYIEGDEATDITDFIYDHLPIGFINELEQTLIDNIEN